jgi:dephospho-CoA kinase
MLHVGLTGGIGTGKSTIAAMFAKRGAYVLDYDELSHYVVEPEKPAWRDIVDFFGPSILREDRTINRPRLGEIVFADADKRRQLQSFIYPRLGEEYARRIQEITQKDPNAIIMADVPLLIETGMKSMFEKIILVYATREQQLGRMTARNGFDLESATKRLNAQMPIEEKLQYADYVVHNTGSLAAAEEQVEGIWNELVSLSRQKTGTP